MIILQLILTKNSGGLGKHYIELCNELSKNNLVIAVCDDSFKEDLSNNIKKIYIPIKYKYLFFLNFFFILKTIVTLKPNIIHSHGNKAASYAAKIKTHSSRIFIATIHWNLKRKKDRKPFENMDGVIGVSKGVLTDIHINRSRVIYNGTAIKNLTSTPIDIHQKFNLNKNKPIVIAIGRMVKGKGFDILLKSWQNIDAQLLLLGDGPFKQHLKELTKEYNIKNNVVFLGHINDTTPFFSIADLSVIPSISEGFSYVLTEALLHKVPIIATSGVNGAREIFNNELLVSPGNTKELHKSIAEALNNISLFTSNFHELFIWAEANLTLKKMTDSNYRFYNEIEASRKTDKNNPL